MNEEQWLKVELQPSEEELLEDAEHFIRTGEQIVRCPDHRAPMATKAFKYQKYDDRLIGIYPPGLFYACSVSGCYAFQRAIRPPAKRPSPLGVSIDGEAVRIRLEVIEVYRQLVWRWCSRAYFIQEFNHLCKNSLVEGKFYFSMLTVQDSRVLLAWIDKQLDGWLPIYQELRDRGVPHVGARGFAAAISKDPYQALGSASSVRQALITYAELHHFSRRIVPIPHLMDMHHRDRVFALGQLALGNPIPKSKLKVLKNRSGKVYKVEIE